MNVSFVEMNVSKLINYSMDICWNGQGTPEEFSIKSGKHGTSAHPEFGPKPSEIKQKPAKKCISLQRG
jgi:hypothetical protein